MLLLGLMLKRNHPRRISWANSSPRHAPVARWRGSPLSLFPIRFLCRITHPPRWPVGSVGRQKIATRCVISKLCLCGGVALITLSPQLLIIEASTTCKMIANPSKEKRRKRRRSKVLLDQLEPAQKKKRSSTRQDYANKLAFKCMLAAAPPNATTTPPTALTPTTSYSCPCQSPAHLSHIIAWLDIDVSGDKLLRFIIVRPERQGAGEWDRQRRGGKCGWVRQSRSCWTCHSCKDNAASAEFQVASSQSINHINCLQSKR